MSNVLGELFGDIADAIREKTGDTATMKPAEFPDKISGIDSASGGTEIDALIDEINGEVVNGKTVTFVGVDGSVLCTISVVHGKNCANPAITGLISKPTKESTATVVYTFSGWSLTNGGDADPKALQNITDDRTVYAAFSASARLYEVRFYDGDKLLATKTTEYGGSVEHEYSKTGYHFNGWNPEPINITSDTACYAQMVQANFSADSWETIVAAAENGEAASKYSVGDEREMEIYNGSGYETVIVRIAGFGVDSLNDGSKAGMTIMAKTPMASARVWNATGYPITEGSSVYVTTRYGFDRADLKTYLDDVVAASFPPALKNGLKIVEKHYNYHNGVNSETKTTGFWKMWIPSAHEVTGTPAYLDGNGHRYSGLYSSDGERIASTYNGTAVKWWTTKVDGTDSARVIGTDGRVSVTSYDTRYENANIIFGFCI